MKEVEIENCTRKVKNEIVYVAMFIAKVITYVNNGNRQSKPWSGQAKQNNEKHIHDHSKRAPIANFKAVITIQI